MQYFANPSTQKVRDAMVAGQLNAIDTPRQGNRAVEGATWCADNGCFSNKWVEAEWWAWLESNAYRADSCAFAVAPDVVADAAATLERSAPWLPRIRALGYPAAFVIQDGQENLPMPWDDFDVMFIGGSTEWKLGKHALELVFQAKARGKWVHMGRVNSERRLRYAHAIGCDSADGTYLTRGPDVNLQKVLGWLAMLGAKPPHKWERRESADSSSVRSVGVQ